MVLREFEIIDANIIELKGKRETIAKKLAEIDAKLSCYEDIKKELDKEFKENAVKE